MKYAIISDMHSNPKALEKVLSDARENGADKIVCLFDPEAAKVEFRRLPFDYVTYAADLRSQGVELPFWLDYYL